jgi:transposase
VRNAIGIDPDAKGFVCAHVQIGQPKVIKKGFMATENDLQSFVRWAASVEDTIIAIEGANGQSRPIEKALREAGIVFYSFKPADTDKFRKAVLGQNKNNQKDAESVARYAMAMEAQGKLERYRRVWFTDMELQLLTRSYERVLKEMTSGVNWLWKLLRHASADLYLALRGDHPEVEFGERMLRNQGILGILASHPDIGQWKNLSDEQLREVMGGGNSQFHLKNIQQLRKLMPSLPQLSPGTAMTIGDSARRLQGLHGDLANIVKALEALTRDNIAIQTLKQTRGIATVTAATMIAEIIDIRRFAREDNLAGYIGLGLREYSTGDTVKMIATEMFNHRLKDAFMTAARNYVHFNPDSHLAGYYRNLIKTRMRPMEATKRVARALVRVIYKTLYSLADLNATRTPAKKTTAEESDMANGVTPSDRSHVSDMPPSSLPQSITVKGKIIKTTRSRKSPTQKRKKRRVA